MGAFWTAGATNQSQDQQSATATAAGREWHQDATLQRPYRYSTSNFRLFRRSCTQPVRAEAQTLRALALVRLGGVPGKQGAHRASQVSRFLQHGVTHLFGAAD